MTPKHKMNSMNKLLKAFFTVVTLALCESAYAGAPFVTDDPEPVAKNNFEVNYALSKTWVEDSTSAALPSVDINYGYLDDVQLHLQSRYTYQAGGGNSQSGLDNTEVGFKYRFVHENKNDVEFMLGIYPMLQLPTGSKKLGDASGRTQLFLPIWAQLNTDKWTLYGGTGYKINNYPSSKNSWFLGATALYHVNDNFKIGGELFRESATTQGDQYSSGFNLGGIYNIKSDYALLFSAGRALNNVSDTNKLSAFLAIQVIY
jgi:hypothetical protein